MSKRALKKGKRRSRAVVTAAMAAAAGEVAAVLPVAAVEVAAALRVSGAALEVSM